MANEYNRIEQSSTHNLALTRNQDNKQVKKPSDGTMTFMLWSVAGTALVACGGPIFGDGTSIGGGGGSRSSGSGGTRVTENGATVPIGDTQFSSVPETGGVYVRPELVNEAGTVVPAAEVRFRPDGGAEDGSDDVDLSAADDAQRGVLTGADVPADFMGTQTVGSATFYFVSEANLGRLVLDPADYEGAERDFQIRYFAYDPADTSFTTPATLADTSTVAVAFEAFDDPATAIRLEGGAQDRDSIDEAENIALTKIADLDIVDPDGGESGTLELVGTHAGMFELGDDDTAIYFSATALLDYEALPEGQKTLNVRVQLEGTPAVGVDVMVDVTNVEPDGAGVESDDPATMVRLVGTAQAVAENTVTMPRTARTEVATFGFDDDDGGSNPLEVVGTNHDLFEIDGNVLYLSEDADVDYETLPDGGKNLNVRVQLIADSTIGVAVVVPVTNVVEAISITEDGATVPIGDTQFSSVPETGGVYVRPELVNEAGTVVQVAEVRFRPDGAGDIDLSAADDAQRGVLTGAGVPTNFMGTQTVGGATFYFVSEANLGRLVLDPADYEGAERDFQIRYFAYDPADTSFTTPATLADTSTVDVAFESVDDHAVTAITIDTQALTMTMETVGNAVTLRTEVAVLNFEDDDETSSDAVELAGTHADLFELDGATLYLRADQRVDFEDEAFTAGDEKLEVRVQRVDDPETTTVNEGTTIGVLIEVAVTDVLETNNAPTSTIAGGTANVAYNEAGATDEAIISFGDTDTDDPNDGLIIRAFASGDDTTEPVTPAYDAGGHTTLGSSSTDVIGDYGTFTIERDDSTGQLSVTYNLDEMNNDDVRNLSEGESLIEKLTVYVHDGEATSTPATTYVVTIQGPVMNSAPTTMTDDDAVTVDYEQAGPTDPATISFDDTEDDNEDLTIRAVASGADGAEDEPGTPDYAADLGEAVTTDVAATVTGSYGVFTIERDDTTGELEFTYDLNQDDGPVTDLRDGGNLIEKLTVYVHDGEDASAAQNVVVTIQGEEPNPTGYYHLPATGQVTVEGATSYAVTNRGVSLTSFDGSDRTQSDSDGGGSYRFSVNNHGEWEAIPIAPLNFVVAGPPKFATRGFDIHAFNGPRHADSVGAAIQIDVHFNQLVVRNSDQNGRSNSELYIGTTGADDFTTGGGTDVIYAREGADTLRLGRNDPDTIYHRFTSSDPGWVNTDGGDTFNNYVRSGTVDLNGTLMDTDTFIFVDMDGSKVSEADFIANANIELWATIATDSVSSMLEITGFEIRFVNDPAADSTITINYHAISQPVIGMDDQKTAFGLATSLTDPGTYEVTNHEVWGKYFGEDEDGSDLQVVDGLPPVFDTDAEVARLLLPPPDGFLDVI